MSSPPPAYETSSLTRGYHSLTPPTRQMSMSTPPSKTSSVTPRGRRSLPLATMKSPLTPLTSWETFSDTDSCQPSASSAAAVSQPPQLASAAASGGDVAKRKAAEAAGVESPVTADDVSFIVSKK